MSWRLGFLIESLWILAAGYVIGWAYQLPLESEKAVEAEFGAPDDVTLVRIRVLQGDVVTGKDRGAIWIEDDRLNFSGHASSFSLARADICSFLDKRKSSYSPRLRFSLDLNCSGPAGPVSVTFDLLRQGTKGRQKIEDQLAIFRGKPWLPERGQLPPLNLGPGGDTMVSLNR